MQVRHCFRSSRRTLGSRFPPQGSRHWNHIELATCATVRVLYHIRILAGAPESMMKILTFYSGLLGHCQDNYITTILPSRLQHVTVLTSRLTFTTFLNLARHYTTVAVATAFLNEAGLHINALFGLLDDFL
jgi:hypothetical protein